MTNDVGHGYNSVIIIFFRVPDCLTVPLTDFVMCDVQIWSQMFLCFGHNLPVMAFASDVVLTSAMMCQLTWR
jgi:hypothetical protein